MLLAELRRRRVTRAQRPRSLEVLERFARSGSIRSYLLGLAWDDCAVAEVAARSYRHANGFYRLVLEAGDPFQPKVRLHVWKPRARVASADIHDHPWDFSSIVLVGTLRHQIFRSCRDGLPLERFSCPTLASSESKPQIVRSGTRRVRVVQDCALAAGSFYFLSRTELHRIGPAEATLAATLVLQEAHQARRTTILNHAAGATQSIIPERMLSSEMVRELLRDVAERCQPRDKATSGG